MADIKIHLLINSINDFESFHEFSRDKIDTKNISYVWYRINNKKDFYKAKTLIDDIPLISPVWFLDKLSLIPEVIYKRGMHIAISSKNLKIDDILKYSGLLLKFKADIYVVDDTIIDDESEKKIGFLKKITSGLEKIGINKVYYTDMSGKEKDVVDSIDSLKRIKKYLDIPMVISFRCLDDKNKTILDNSLLLGNLFYEGIGDSVIINFEDINKRADLLKENIELIKTILGSLNLMKIGYTIISCPKCGRCQMDLLKINREVNRYLSELEVEYNKRGVYFEDIGGVTVAVMGCNVNGPGEARGADIGIAGGKNGKGTIFKNGIPFETLPENKVVDKFFNHVKKLIDKKIKDSGIKIA